MPSYPHLTTESVLVYDNDEQSSSININEESFEFRLDESLSNNIAVLSPETNSTYLPTLPDTPRSSKNMSTTKTPAHTLRRGNKARSNPTYSNMSQSNTAAAAGDDSVITGGLGGSLAEESLVRSLPHDEDEHNLVQQVGRNSPINNTQNNKLQKKKMKKEGGCWSNFKAKCGANGGFNLLTYILLLSFFVLLVYASSVLSTYLNYNRDEYRDWSLVGGVTSTSANFRVRGPSIDDGIRREFIIGTNPNLAIEADQIRNIPVAFQDYIELEHFVKAIYIDTLEPTTPYYYGITRPQRTPNSAVMAGNVGYFVTPAPEGTRMDFTIATGSCSLTGSKSSSFSEILALNPLMFFHMGDISYEDLNTLDIDERLSAYDRVMGSPSQRLLYQRTIFSYMWDDHDWLGSNSDSNDEATASVAKQGYSLAIPHYPLGSTSSDIANAAKYQAFTIGTVRFIVTDLRSESIKSTDQFAGQIYSTEQKEWLFNEFDQAVNYDYVVWVTTRPWTDPVKVGSDSWGGFEAERQELSAYIASTIGAGPRNLLVLSGDNHMVAFDDGTNTDYSGQDVYPGGFPLLHSGPLANYGPGATDLFSTEKFHFTEGCMASSSEVNHHFSTVDFSFPSDTNQLGCVRIRSYANDASNIIFEKEMCGEVMKTGTPETDTCTTKRMAIPTYSMFSAAAALVLFGWMLTICLLGCKRLLLSLCYFGLGILFYFLTIVASFAGAITLGNNGVNMFAVSICVLAEAVVGTFFVFMAIIGYRSTGSSEEAEIDDDRIDMKRTESESDDAGDEVVEIGIENNGSEKEGGFPPAFIVNDLSRVAPEDVDEITEVKSDSSTIRKMKESIASGSSSMQSNDDFSGKNLSSIPTPEDEAVPNLDGIPACDLNHSFGEGLGFVAAYSRGLFSFGNKARSPKNEATSPGETYGRLDESDYLSEDEKDQN